MFNKIAFLLCFVTFVTTAQETIKGIVIDENKPSVVQMSFGKTQ
jgi:hypothetical protein